PAVEKPEALQHGGVFDASGDDVRGPATAREEDSLKRMVVGFASAAGKDDLGWFRTHQRGDFCARRLDRLARPLPGPVTAGRIAEILGQERPHGLDDFGGQWSAGIVIKIYPVHRSPCCRLTI